MALAFAGLLFVPAVYAWIYLVAMWDPASHTQDLPAGLVNLDTGAPCVLGEVAQYVGSRMG